MAFLAPFFLVGLAALAVPVIIHMIQRERKDVIEFPSLMFVRKIPFHSFRRQRIRHWLLLLMRCAALMLLIAAFARPFFRTPTSAAATSGAREVVILLDRSFSMAYEDRWNRAKTAATNVIDDLGVGDRATIIFFDSGAQVGPRSMTDSASLIGLVNDADLGAGVTRYGPALKLAEGIFEDSSLPRLEAVLISDFQRSGLDSVTGVHFPEGTVLTPVSVDTERRANVSVAGVLFEREYFSGRERVAVVARVTNRGAEPVTGLAVTLELDGREVESLATDLPLNGSATVDFSAVTLGDGPVTGTVRIERDALPTDDVFHFVVSPGQVINVLLVGNSRGANDSSLYLNRALGIGATPAFNLTTKSLGDVVSSDLNGQQVVILNDTQAPAGQVGQALRRFVENGGGLLVVAGERSNWSTEDLGLLPGTLGSPSDRMGRGGALGFIDYSHPVFELFTAPRSGDMTSARFFRYRPVEAEPTATVLARYDNGEPALTEWRVGDGTSLLWSSTLDSFWNDLALKPVYLPFIHRVTQHLASYVPSTSWHDVGQVLNLAEQRSLLADTGLSEADLVAVSPSGRRVSVSESDRAGFVTLEEQGLYEIRDVETTGGPSIPLAVNVDLAESELTTLDPAELASLVTGYAGGSQESAAAPPRVISPEDLEQRQGIWWNLLVVALLLFAGETIVSNRLSRHAVETV